MPSLALEPLPVPRTTPPRTAAGRWFHGGPRLDQPHLKGHSAPWYRVLWLTGVDYFSTLGFLMSE